MADKKDAKYLEELLKYQKELNNSMNNSTNIQDKIKLNEELISNEKRIQREHEEVSKLSKKEISKLSAEEKKLLNDIVSKEKEINTELTKQVKRRQFTIDLAKQLGQQLKLGWKYLQDADKIIKSTNLSLGMSGAKAVAMRDAFEKSAGYVTRLGGSIADIQGVMQGYADETGRARALSSDMVKDITAIGKGTGLGIEQAAKLGAQFELMGYDAKGTMDYVQGVVDTSERMGVNTTKVLKNVNDNFKKLNTYTFQQGVKGFAQMAMYAEKFKIDIGQALNAADVARSLEGAIDLAAQLQVMGGEFAKTDPFEMLFLSRNDPAKFTEKIADMTKGVVSFRKMADGSFEKYISPADRDRLAAVAKSMGMEASALTEIAERQAEIQKMRQEMGGLGLSGEQKEAIEGAAFYNKETGKFQVKLADTMINIKDLTHEQAKKFENEQVLLKDRAKQAMTFDETFKATINSLKTALLPLLKNINGVLTWLSPSVDKLGEISGKGGGLMKAVLLLGGTVAGLKGAAFLMNKGVSNWISTGSAFKGVGGKAATGGIRGFLGGGSKAAAGAVTNTTGSAAAGVKGGGLNALGKGVGIGAAGAGMGAGIMLAAKGLSELADSMAKLTPEQAKSLERIAITMAITFPVAAVGIALAGTAASAGALGFLALGAAFVGIGFGIKLATTGIGKMGEGLAKLNESGGGAGKELLSVAGGVAAITLAMGAGGLISMFAFNKSLSKMSKNSSGIEKIGAAFANIQTVLSGTKEDFLAVENAIASIGNSNVRGGGLFTELSNLLKKPLQVEFANNGKVSLTNDITLNLDGQRFMNKSYDVNIAVQKHESLKHGKGS